MRPAFDLCAIRLRIYFTDLTLTAAEICEKTHVFPKLNLLTNHIRLVLEMSRKTMEFCAMLTGSTGSTGSNKINRFYGFWQDQQVLRVLTGSTGSTGSNKINRFYWFWQDRKLTAGPSGIHLNISYFITCCMLTLMGWPLNRMIFDCSEIVVLFLFRTMLWLRLQVVSFLYMDYGVDSFLRSHA